MTQKNIITLALLIIILVPTVGYAEVYYLSNKDGTAPKIKTIPPSTIERNKKEQVLNALNALDQNINMVDKSIKQTLIRIKGVDPSNSKLTQVNEYVEGAATNLTEAEKIVNDTRDLLANVSINDKESITKIKEQISNSKKLTHESISQMKKAILLLKKMKIIQSNETLN